MSRDSHNPTDNGRLFFVDRRTIAKAQHDILGCVACSEAATIPFDWVLDRMLGRGRLGSESHYVLETPATCLRCGALILEKTLVEVARPNE